MILHPAVLTLLFVCIVATSMVFYASFYGIRIIRRWNIKSGSEEQLVLERRTYLISMILSCVLAFEAASLFLYIFTADNLHPLFTGTMCAAGTLNVNEYGYPTLLLKLVNFILAGLWLIINFADNRGYDYPLIRVKYGLLLVIAPLVTGESVAETVYFLKLKGDVITSCCGSLFSAGNRNVASDMAAVPMGVAAPGFFAAVVLTLGLGIFYGVRRKGAVLFSAAGGLCFVMSVISLISFITLYFYELPTHHCPFCILQKEYGYIGYLLYGALLAGVVSGLGVGALSPFRKVGSLSGSLPTIQARLTVVCLTAYTLFAAASLWQIVFSGLTLRQ